MHKLEAKITRETEKAILIDGNCWLPKSQITIGETDESEITTIEIPNWLAEKKGIVCPSNITINF